MRPIGRVVAAALLVPALVRGQESADRWARQVRANLKRAAQTLAGAGFRGARDDMAGTLNTGESATFPVTLRAGASYAMIAVCDNDCAILELVLRDAGDHDVAADRSDRVPVIRATPHQTARYRVTIVMASCDVNPCRYGIGVYVHATSPAP